MKVSKNNNEIIKFLFVGGLNAVFTFLIFSGALYLLRLHYLVSLTLAWILGNIFTYVINFVWVFKPEKNFSFHTRFLKYISANLFSLILNLATLDIIVRSRGLDPFYAQLILVIPLITCNYLLAKFWSLRKKQTTDAYT